MKSRERTILIIKAVKMTGEEIGIIKNKNRTFKHFIKEFPEYCVRLNNGYIDYTYNYLQFTEDGKQEYIMFDTIGADALLQFEIDECGLEDVLRATDLRSIFNKLDVNIFDDWFIGMPNSAHLVIDLIYSGGEYMGINGDSDFDVEIKLVGYLNTDRELIEL